MSEPPSPSLEQIALSLADGVPVDWDAAAQLCPDGAAGVVRGLRAIEGLIRPQPLAAPGGPADDGLGDGQTTWGPLEVIERVGRGSFGDVYRAIDTRLGREVALKLIRNSGGEEGLSERAVAEGRRLARVHHPNVVTVFGAELIDGRYGIWMELMPGPTLAAEVTARGPLPVAEAAVVTRDLAGALAAVHAAGLLHRDIKAQNVLRAADGRPILADFGAGRDRQTDAGAAHDRAGTPVYVAPEVLMNGHASVASDIYSLGVLLYLLLTGRYPVSGGSVSEIARAHQEGRVAPAAQYRRGIGRRLASIVSRATDPEPSKRFESAADLERALTAWLRSRRWRRALVSVVRTGGASAIDAVIRLPPARRASAALGVLLVAAMLSGAAVYAVADYAGARADVQADLVFQSRLLLQTTKSLVQTGDVRRASGVLAGLGVNWARRVRLACLYDSQGQLFVQQRPAPPMEPHGEETVPPECSPRWEPEAVFWGDGDVRFAVSTEGRTPAERQSLRLLVDIPWEIGAKARVALVLVSAAVLFVAMTGGAAASWLVRRTRTPRTIRTPERSERSERQNVPNDPNDQYPINSANSSAPGSSANTRQG